MGVICCTFPEHLFLRTPLVGYFRGNNLKLKKNLAIFTSEKYVKGYFALSHLLVSHFLHFSKIIRKTEYRLQYASSDETFLTLSNLNTKVKKFYKHQYLGSCVLGFSSRVLAPEFWVLGSRVLGSQGSES